MRLEHADFALAKGWHVGRWNADLDLSIGYATQGVDEPHVHTWLKEIYLVACGTAEIRVGHETYRLERGDVVVVEPGEPHTFVSSSPDYFHFVVQTPGITAEAVQVERRAVTRTELGL